MGEVRTEITLVNIRDTIKAQEGLIPESEIKRLTVNAMVDTGAWTLVINEAVREKLGLQITGTDPGTLADGTDGQYDLAGPLRVSWKDRSAVCDAVVLPHAKEVLLGAIPLEAMDLMVHPRTEEVAGAHGAEPLHFIG